MAIGLSPCIASNSEAEANAHVTTVSTTYGISVPTGVFFNGTDFVKVDRDWVRIVINRQIVKECGFTAQMDPNDNYVLKLEKGGAITMYPNGRALIYDGVKYSK